MDYSGDMLSGWKERFHTPTGKERASMSEEIEQEQQQSDEITGPLPGGRRLAHPLYVTIAHDNGETIVSEPHFHMHASAPTTTEALTAFRRIFSGYLDVLVSREDRLDPYLREQLAYLRSYISAE